MRATVIGLLLATAALPGRAVAQYVDVVAGNVVYHSATGTARGLTHAGLDTLATLSPDGSLVAFVRRTPDVLVPTALEADEATELWIVRVDGTGARRLV